MSHPPNIIFLTIDCWRGDHFGRLYAASPLTNQPIQTPNLDKLAAEGTVFANAHACGGWTKLAMTALFSSAYASMYGYVDGMRSAERLTISEVLRQHGYATAGVTSNFICGRQYGFERGFDTFIEAYGKFASPLSAKLRQLPYFESVMRRWNVPWWLAKAGVRVPPYYSTPSADDVNQRGLAWLQDHEDKPYFLWLHYMDLHWPYISDREQQSADEIQAMWDDYVVWRHQVLASEGTCKLDEAMAERWKQLYHDALVKLDRSIGELVERLKQRDEWEQTIVVVTGDHGEGFYEHGRWQHAWNRLHKIGTHVPLIMRVPTSKTPSVIDEPVSHLDVVPTLLHLAAIDQPKSMHGQSLEPLLTSETWQTKPLYTEMMGVGKSTPYRLSIRSDEYLYIYDIEAPQNTQLYNCQTDPEERLNIYADQPAVSRSFDQLRLRHLASAGIIGPTEKVRAHFGAAASADDETDPAIVEQLRSLGYLE